MDTIEFPGLWNLHITVNKVAFEIFGIPIYWYGIIIACAFLVAVILAIKQSSKFGIEPDDILDLILYIVPAGIIGARLYYVIFSWNEFDYKLIDIIDIRKGGLAIYGAIIGGIIAGFIFAKVKKIKVLKLFDFTITYVPLAQAIGRWGNFINQEAYGINTDLPWGMTSNTIRNELSSKAEKLLEMGIYIDPSKPVHPTFLYESLWDLGVFILLIWFRKRKKVDGEVFSLYMISYGIGRAWIEGLRTDSLMMGTQRISQVLSIILAIAFAILFAVLRKHVSRASLNEVTEPVSSEYKNILEKLRNEKEEEKVEWQPKENEEQEEEKKQEEKDWQKEKEENKEEQKTKDIISDNNNATSNNNENKNDNNNI